MAVKGYLVDVAASKITLIPEMSVSLNFTQLLGYFCFNLFMIACSVIYLWVKVGRGRPSQLLRAWFFYRKEDGVCMQMEALAVRVTVWR